MRSQIIDLAQKLEDKKEAPIVKACMSCKSKSIKTTSEVSNASKLDKVLVKIDDLTKLIND